VIDLTRIGRLHVVLLAASAVLAYVTRWLDPSSLLLGGIVMGINFWLLRVISSGLIGAMQRRADRKRIGVALAAMTLKFALFIGLLGLLFWRLPIEGLSFAIGVTLLLVACLIEVAAHQPPVAKGTV
jgi:hypothetical protein